MFRRRSYLKFTAVIFVLLMIVFYFPESYFEPEDNVQNKLVYKNARSLFDYNLLMKILKLNFENKINNGDKFSVLNDADLVIVVQVHKRLSYLKSLILSLSKVKFINETLIIFSHDFFDEEINDTIQKINFTKTCQIFYPFSIQIWMNAFPGTSINDCPKDSTKYRAKELGCVNAANPDSYGHYREAHITQTKHHWWWKLHYIMEHLSFTKHHQGDFLLAEEDHYFSPDFIHVWKLMKFSQRSLKNVDLLTLGNYEKFIDLKMNSNKINLTNWFSSKFNMAFTMDRLLWSKIKSCQLQFCTYDDYNWDWSLQFLINNCLRRQLMTLVVVIPRVYHIGTCGLHHKSKTCDIKSQTEKLNKFFDNNKNYLFPSSLITVKKTTTKFRLKKNGGWSDPRDQQLCNQFQINFDDVLLKRFDNFMHCIYSDSNQFQINSYEILEKKIDNFTHCMQDFANFLKS